MNDQWPIWNRTVNKTEPLSFSAVLKIHEMHFVPLVLKLKPQQTISRAATSINETESLLRMTWKNIPIFFFAVSDNNLVSLLLYGDDEFDGTKTWKILISTIRFHQESQWFDEQRFW